MTEKLNADDTAPMPSVVVRGCFRAENLVTAPDGCTYVGMCGELRSSARGYLPSW